MKSYFQLYTDDTSTASQIYDSLLYVRGINAGSLAKNQEGDDDVSTVEEYDTYMPIRFYNVKSKSDGSTPTSPTHTFFNVYNRAEYAGPDGQNMYDLYADYNIAKLSGASYITNSIGGSVNYGIDGGSGDSQTIPAVYGAYNWAKSQPTGSSRTVTYLMASRNRSHLNKSDATVTYAYPTTSEFTQTTGNVGTLAMHKFDLDYTAGNITNAYFIWADESSLPTPSGEKFFIKSNIPWPTSLAGSLTNTGAVTFSSTLSVSGTATFNSDVSLQDNDKLKIGTGNDLQIYHDGSNSYIDGGAAAGNLIIRNRLASGDVIFQGDNGDGDGSQTTYFQLDNSMANTGNPDVYTRFPDNSRLTFGNSANANSLDLEIYHDGSDSHIKNKGGDFNIESNSGIYITNDTADEIYIEQKCNDGDIIFKCDNGSGGTTEYFRVDGSSENVLFSRLIKLADNVELRVGDGNDLKLYHDASNSYIKQSGVGDLIIQQSIDDKDILFQSDDGSGGVTTYMFLDGSTTLVQFYKSTKHIENIKANFGNSADMSIYHDSNDARIENSTGDIVIQNETNDRDIKLRSDDGSGGTTDYIFLDGSEVSTKILTQKVIMSNLPTSNPNNAGQLYNDSGTLKVSAG